MKFVNYVVKSNRAEYARIDLVNTPSYDLGK